VTVFLLADGRLEGNGLLGDLEDLSDLLEGELHLVGDLLGRGLPPQLLHEVARRADQLVDRLDHVHGDPDRPRLVCDRAGDGLPDPPGRIGGELVAPLVLELVDGLHETDVAFLDEVEELQPPVRVLLGDAHDEPQVGLDELALGGAGLLFAGLDGLDDLPEVRRGEPRLGLDALEGLSGLLEALLVFLEPCRRDPKVFRDLAFVLLALAHLREGALQGLQRQFRLRADQPDLGLGRVDLGEILLEPGDHPLDALLAQVDLPAGLHDVPVVLGDPGFQVLSFRFPETLFPELASEGVVAPVDLRDPVDELDHALAVDLLLDEAVVVLDVVHDALDAQLPLLELPAHPDDVLHRGQHAEDGVGDLPLAFLDLLGDLHLLVAVQEGNEAHFAEVHLHRVPRAGGAGQQGQQLVFLFLLGLGGFIDRFLEDDLLPLVRVDDVDVLLPEEHDDLVDLVRRHDVRGQHLVDIVVGQEPLFLAQRDELLDLVGLDLLGQKGLLPFLLIAHVLFAHGVIVPFRPEGGCTDPDRRLPAPAGA